MARHLVVGAGPVGSHTALLLADAGHDVRLVTRSGGGPAHPLIERVAFDASDPAAMATAAAGAAAVYNCANPAYHRWVSDWPPIATALLDAAAAYDAVLVTMSNLYGYGPVDAPMTEDTPLAATGVKGRVRAQMWEQALAAHEAGRVRVTEARASDFFGPGVVGSHLGERVVPRLLAGKGIRVIGDPDQPHSWTYVPDVARTLVTLANDERAWGRAWHVPSPPPLTQREAITRLCEAAGVPAVSVGAMPAWALRAAGLVVPMLRELREVTYQFEAPFVLDSSRAESTFGLTPTAYDEATAATVAWWRARTAGEGQRSTTAA